MRKKIQMKNWAAILMVCLMMMALCACGKEKDSDLQKSVSETEAADAMEFAGDTPGYGISYTDAEGNVRKYAICESGFDGSIYLLRY